MGLTFFSPPSSKAHVYAFCHPKENSASDSTLTSDDGLETAASGLTFANRTSQPILPPFSFELSSGLYIRDPGGLGGRGETLFFGLYGYIGIGSKLARY